jgi:hypothetical protein
MRDRWRAELQRRADARREEQRWQELVSMGEKGITPELYGALADFLRTYPNSSHRAEAEKVKANVEATVAQQFDDRIAYASECLRKYDVHAALYQLKLLEMMARLTVSDSQQAALQGLRDRVQTTRQQIQNQYNLLGTRTRMISDDDIIEVRRVCQLVLAVDQDHYEARQLLEKADRIGGRKAAKYLQQAKLYRNMHPRKSRDYLKRCVRIDPYGVHGREANGLL